MAPSTSFGKEEIDKLLEIASQKITEKEENKKFSDVYMFIVDKGIKPGKEAFSPTQIYKCYVDWSTSPRAQNVFSKEFKRYFYKCFKKRKGKNYYMLDPLGLDLSHDAEIQRLEDLRERYKKDNDQQKERKQQGSETKE